MPAPISGRALFQWNGYLKSLVIRDAEAIKFIEWCRDKEFDSLLFATQVYAASTGIVLKPQDFVPF